MVVLPEGRGGTVLLFLEDTVEITEVIESTGVTDLRNTLGCVYQHPAGIAETDVNDIVTEVTSCAQLEEAAECRGAHPCDIRQYGKTYLIRIVLVDIVLDFQYTTRVTLTSTFAKLLVASVRAPSHFDSS